MKTALITGATSGIGSVLTAHMLRDGWTIIGFYNDTSSAPTEQLLTQLPAGSSQNLILDRVDVTNFEMVNEAISKHLKSHNILNLVNCAGIAQDRTAKKMSPSEWSNVINVNLTGAFNVIQALLPNLIQNNYGRIVSISSIIGFTGNFGQSNYAASKAGLVALSKSIALETAKYDITVNCVAPGFIEVGMTMRVPKDILDNIISTIPKKRLGRPEEVSRAVRFLLEEDNSFITGQVLHVNGGHYM